VFIPSDKNSLFDRGSIGEMGLCFKKNKSQYMGGLGYRVARGIVRNARAGEAGLLKIHVPFRETVRGHKVTIK
jgi:hypothetical protein